jgi:general secretion pathway protein D
LRFPAVAVCCLVALLCEPPLPSLAQTINLTAANVEVLRNGGARLALTFSSGVPKYQIYGNGTNQITVMLFGTTPATNAPTVIPAVGPIATGQVSSAGTTTTILLYARDPANARVSTGPGQTLLVDLSSTRTAAQKPSPSPAKGGPTIIGAQGVITKVVPLKYADVSEIVGILSGTSITPTSTFQPQANAGNFGTPSTLGTGAGGSVAGFGPSTSPSVNYASVSGENGAQESVGQRINEHIAIDRRLNAIIFTGTAAQIAGYEAIVDAIDVPLRAVMLQTEIVELTDTAAKNVGIDFTNGAGGGQIASATFVSPNPTGGTAVSNQISLQAAIYAQVQKGNGRIIATPRILALDGKPASILTGDALPIITSIAVSGVNHARFFSTYSILQSHN